MKKGGLTGNGKWEMAKFIGFPISHLPFPIQDASFTILLGISSVAREGSTPMPPLTDSDTSVLTAWRTNSRVTAYLVEHLPAALWDAPLPGAPRRTVRMIAGHLHNARCMWLKTLGEEHGIAIPASVDRRKVSRHELLSALKRSSKGIEALLELGIAAGGHVPPSKGYVWRNLPLDVPHVLTYFVAHEGHHRGQIVMLARQLGHRLPTEISAGLWQWTKRVQEVRRARQ
jgi:uncharacterized damage-inducible protein DinB